MGALTWLLFVVPVPAWVTVLCVGRARRLHRLHVRIDAARAGLDAALRRRAQVALQVAGARVAPEVMSVVPAVGHDGSGPVPGTPLEDDPAAALRAAATVALAGIGEREAVENLVGRRLAAVGRSGLPHPLLVELVDAEQLVVLARHVHNDAVRDTLGLRSRRLVRWLRLAGTAPVPAYFEIADPAPAVASVDPPC